MLSLLKNVHVADGKAGDTKTISTNKEPFISIYDTSTLKKRKVLPGTEIGSREYVAICFTSDAKMIAAQGDQITTLFLQLWAIIDTFRTPTNELGGLWVPIPFSLDGRPHPRGGGVH